MALIIIMATMGTGAIMEGITADFMVAATTADFEAAATTADFEAAATTADFVAGNTADPMEGTTGASDDNLRPARER